jgi:hypothetical protein
MNSSIGLRLAVALVAILFHAGALWENTWSAVDDGNDLERMLDYSQRLEDGTFGVGFAATLWAHTGLFRPGFVFVRLAEYKLFGLNCLLHHAAHVLVMLIVCQLLFSIAQRATGSRMSGALTALLFIVFSPNVENWFRLGDPTFYPAALAVASVGCVARGMALTAERSAARAGWLAAALACLVPAYFTRETCIALIGLGAGMALACAVGAGELLSRRNLRFALVYLVGHVALGAGWFAGRHWAGVKAIGAGSYSQDYQISPVVMATTALKYCDVLWNGLMLLFPAAVLLFAWRLWLWTRGRAALDNRDGWSWVGLCWFLACGSILLPWKHPLARYIGPAVPGLCLFVGVTVSRLFGDMTAARRPRWESILRWALLANLPLLALAGFIRNYNYYVFRHDFDLAAAQARQVIAQQAPADARLFVNMPPDSEHIFNETTKLLKVLNGRPDLTQFNFNAPDRPEPRRGDLFLVFVREPATPRSTEMWLPESFHTATLERLKDRLSLARGVRFERQLLSAYPDAPIFNLVASAGIRLPDYMGMKSDHRRALFMREPSLVEWRVYRFEK